MRSSCISSDRMREFLSGILTAAGEDSITRHMESCSRCEQLAAELSDDEPTRRLARNRAPANVANPPEVDDLCRRVHALGLLNMAVEGSQDSQQGWPGGASSVVRNALHGSDRFALQMVVRDETPNGPARLTRLGAYDVLRKLGAGSFGIVYLAEDRVLHRQVAIKVARASVLTDPTLRQRFFREAEALARLEHPNILPVYEAGEIDGLCYLVLAYCDGPTLHQWMDSRSDPLSGEDATRLILPIVEAVYHAHGRGILHRDIKPANILLPAVEPAPALPTSLKLTDFGLAKVLEEKGSETLAGIVLGTVDYMAPEQAAGHLERIGPATDVYSIGAVLFELITGRLPIEGNSTLDTLRRLLIDEPPEASQIVREVSKDLSAIVCKCLQKSPSQRYGSAAALADDLNRFLMGQPTVARPLSSTERLSRWVRRRRAFAALLSMAATVICLSLGLFYSASRLSRSQSQVRHAAKKLDLATEQVQRSDLFVAQQSYANDLAAAGKSTAKGDIAHATEVLRRQIPADGKPDLRGWEWHYLWGLNTNKPRVFTDAGNEIYHLCRSPNGRDLAAVGSRALLRIYDADDLKLRFAIPTGQGEANCAAFSPDGLLAAIAGDDGTIRVYDLESRQERLRIDAHPGKAFGVVFYDGQKKLASCGAEPVIRLWDASSGESVGALEKHEGRVEAIALSPDGELLASAGNDKTAVVWRLGEKKMKRTFTGHRAALMCICFSPNGRLLATGAMDNNVMLWNVESGRRQDDAHHLDNVQSLAFAADGSRLYVGDRHGAVHQYRVRRKQPSDNRLQLDPDPKAKAWHAHETRIWSVIAGGDADTFYTSGADHVVRKWDRRQHASNEKTFAGPRGEVLVDVEYSPDGKLLFVLADSSGVIVLDAATLQVKETLRAGGRAWWTMKVLEGRDEVAAGDEYGDVAIWNYKTGKLRQMIEPIGERRAVRHLAFSRASGLLALSADNLEHVQIYDADTAEEIARLPAASRAAIAFASSGRQIAIDQRHQIGLFDLKTQQRLLSFPVPSSGVNSICFSPDGRLVAAGNSDRTVRVWSTAGEHIINLTSHLAPVNQVEFTPDGGSLLSRDDSGAIDVANVAARQALFPLPIGAQRLKSMAIAPDNRQLALIRAVGKAYEVVLLGSPAVVGP